MTRLWLLVHIAGFVFWLGGGFSAMLLGIRARRENRSIQGAVARMQGELHRVLIGPGAVLTLLSGIVLTFGLMGTQAPLSAWLMLMQGAGLLGGGLVIFVSLPTAFRLARVDPTGDTAGLFDALRRRQAIAGSIAGTLGLLALLAGAMVA